MPSTLSDRLSKHGISLPVTEKELRERRDRRREHLLPLIHRAFFHSSISGNVISEAMEEMLSSARDFSILIEDYESLFSEMPQDIVKNFNAACERKFNIGWSFTNHFKAIKFYNLGEPKKTAAYIYKPNQIPQHFGKQRVKMTDLPAQREDEYINKYALYQQGTQWLVTNEFLGALKKKVGELKAAS